MAAPQKATIFLHERGEVVAYVCAPLPRYAILPLSVWFLDTAKNKVGQDPARGFKNDFPSIKVG
jgi:hypothetical protein